MYEVRHRSVKEHQSYSFEIERENLKFVYEASLDYQTELSNINRLEDKVAHPYLGGAIFKQKLWNSNRVFSLGYLGLAGVASAYYPHLVQLVG